MTETLTVIVGFAVFGIVIGFMFLFGTWVLNKMETMDEKPKPEPKPDYKFTSAVKDAALEYHKTIIDDQNKRIRHLETQVTILEERLKTYEEICR